MKETWRWFGPRDPVTLMHARQAGATGIVTALHDVPIGQPWPVEDALARKTMIEAHGLAWSVVESIPVSDDLLLRSGDWRAHLDAYKASMRAVAAAGVEVICCNVMPVVDWTRTDLLWPLPHGGFALRFDATDFAACDLFILERQGAERDYAPERVTAARERFAAMSPEWRATLEKVVIAGLPGNTNAAHDRASFMRTLDRFRNVTAEDLRTNLVGFLQEIVPVAEELGLRLAIHPDDPPYPLFGLPRIVSTAADARAILAAVPSQANGLTLCVGSYGVRADNDLIAMVREFSSRIHFAHLRDVTREADGSFHEADHLGGSSDMVGIVAALLDEERRRLRERRADWEIPMRPDHGHLLGDDREKPVNPGYSFIGRLKGLAELRGVMRALSAANT